MRAGETKGTRQEFVAGAAGHVGLSSSSQHVSHIDEIPVAFQKLPDRARTTSPPPANFHACYARVAFFPIVQTGASEEHIQGTLRKSHDEQTEESESATIDDNDVGGVRRDKDAKQEGKGREKEEKRDTEKKGEIKATIRAIRGDGSTLVKNRTQKSLLGSRARGASADTAATLSSRASSCRLRGRSIRKIIMPRRFLVTSRDYIESYRKESVRQRRT